MLDMRKLERKVWDLERQENKQLKEEINNLMKEHADNPTPNRNPYQNNPTTSINPYQNNPYNKHKPISK